MWVTPTYKKAYYKCFCLKRHLFFSLTGLMSEHWFILCRIQLAYMLYIHIS